MVTAEQIVFTKLLAFVIALVAAWWWHSEGFGWMTTVIAGVGAYIFWKIAIAITIGRYQGALLRAEMDAVDDKLRPKR